MCGSDVGGKLRSQPIVFGLLPNGTYLKAFLVELSSVGGDICPTRAEKYLSEALGLRRPTAQKVTAQQIKVSGLATERPFPNQKRERPLQDKAFSFRKLSQAVEQPLQRKACKKDLILLPCLSHAVQATIPNRLCDRRAHSLRFAFVAICAGLDRGLLTEAH